MTATTHEHGVTYSLFLIDARSHKTKQGSWDVSVIYPNLECENLASESSPRLDTMTEAQRSYAQRGYGGNVRGAFTGFTAGGSGSLGLALGALGFLGFGSRFGLGCLERSCV